ncbi:hypothetical protein A6F49_04105 [Enteractinococcus helveticum]|uniref:Amidase domain-containing protein n=1 Tax=Enteractinococcus helveticum TaxID=1837282 RepID=A0A1B7M2Q2_9MICC|nr:hypothetical protein A6F49_04105 [Enteractinococcus helveticum]
MNTQISEIYSLRSALDNGSVTAKELSETAIRRATAADDTFITIAQDTSRAEASDRRIQAREIRSPLEGIPIAVKDVINTADLKTTMGSNVFADYQPTQNATLVQQLDDAGANIIGKTNTQEFSYGIRGDSGAFGVVTNPYDPTRIAGGSSSGSAAAVARDIVPLAVGTDTAGSIRVPAALCGVVGFKPTFQLLDTTGIFPLAPSFDTVGFLASTVQDIAVAMATLLREKNMSEALSAPNLRYAVLEDNLIYGGPGLKDPHALEVVNSLCASRVSHPVGSGTDFNFMELYNVVRAREAFLIHEPYVTQMPEKYQPDILMRVKAGETISETQVAEAQDQIAKAALVYEQAFANTDILLSSTVPIEAPLLHEKASSAEALMSQCVIWNLLGWPAMTIPYWISDSPLPRSLQIIGKPGQDAKVIAAGTHLEDLLNTGVQGRGITSTPRSKTPIA